MSFILTISIIIWILLHDSKYVIAWWNRHIRSECELQNSQSLNGIPSYHNAWNSSNKTISQLHQLITINHSHILEEVNTAFNRLSHSEDHMWIRFMSDWTSNTDQVPTLKRITALFPEIINLRVAIFNPGTTLIDESNPMRITHKYHYGLKVPRNDIGLKIKGFDVKWEEGEGFVWDDTLPHSIWNHTSEQRIIIFADVLRDFSLVNLYGSKLIYSLFQHNAEIIQKKAELKEEAIILEPVIM